MWFFIDAVSISGSGVFYIKHPDFLNAAVALGTIGMAFFVGIQSYFIRKSTEQQERSLRLPLMAEHTKKIQKEVLMPLTSLFERHFYVDVANKKVTLHLDSARFYEVEGTEKLEKLCTTVGIKINPALLNDLLDNHAPDLEQAFIEFMSAVFSLNRGHNQEESLKTAKQRLEEIRRILEDLRSYEVFLDECPYVKGSKREQRKRK